MDLKSSYYELYGTNDITQYRWEQLLSIMEHAKKTRPSALKKADQDGNGWIDEADEIFSKLLIWQKDENGNDILRGLGAAGVGAIYLGNVNTEFSLNSQTDNKTNAVVRQTGMYLKEDGTAGTMQQIDLAQ